MNSIFPQLEGVIAKISKTNALYPLLVAFALSVAIVVIVFTLTDNFYLHLATLLIPLIIAYKLITCYEYFSKNNPDMLRSETHVIQKQALAIIGDEAQILKTKPADIIAILNPDNPVQDKDKISLPEHIETQVNEDPNLLT